MPKPVDLPLPGSADTLTKDNKNQIAQPESETASCDVLLESINYPADVARLSVPELEQLAGEVRQYLIENVAQTGGHLAPSLGVVDLTLAMLSVFNPDSDKIVWDVGHQSYTYKLLTGRKNRFHTLRQLDGLSGFPNRSESAFDHFGTGHASTSISAALGMAVARDLRGESYHVVSVIGDGSLTGGMAYEGLNHAGSTDRPFIVILNDNEMSITKNVGALSLFMSRNLSARWVRRIKREVEDLLQHIPGIGDDLLEIARRSKHSFKNFFTPGILFEALHFNYIGAVDGHNIEELQKVLRLAASQDKPVLVHVLTHKGKGYKPAEEKPEVFHGVGRFDPETGTVFPSKETLPSYTEVFGKTLTQLADTDQRIVAITAAMPTGTGLSHFATCHPDRFFDVGIAEQHAVTFAAGLATQGLRPFLAIYSTFLQRSYDQVIHDVCIQNLPVTFCIDRAGVVGEDGATHQGAFDFAYLRHIPNITIFAPKDEAELQQGLATALQSSGPFALRYPRGVGPGVALKRTPQPLPVGQGEFLCRSEGGLAIIAIGSMVMPAFAAATALKEEGHAVTLFNARGCKPLDKNNLKEIAEQYDKICIIEEHSLAAGFSSAVLEYYADAKLLHDQCIERLGLPDSFLTHGTADSVKESIGLDVESLKKNLRELLFHNK